MGILNALWAVIKGLGLGNVIGKGLVSGAKFVASRGRWLLRHWELIVIAILVLTLLGVKWQKNRVIADLTVRLNHSNSLLAAIDSTISQNRKALEQCLAVNHENAWSYEVMRKRAEQAENAARQIASDSANKIEGIHDEAKTLRGRDDACRRLDAPLPDWFDQWLRE